MIHYWPFLFVCALLVPVGLFILLKARRMFLFIKPELLRRNVVTYLAGLCLYLSFAPLFPDFRNIITEYGWLNGLLLYSLVTAILLLIPYNIALVVIEHPRFQKVKFIWHQVLILLTIIISSILVTLPVNYIFNDYSTRYFKHSALLTFYFSFFGGLVYLFIRYNELEKSKRLMDKELELARINELKIKSDLDALQSKINPHFLYNSLNSIADLTLTDGKKAYKMTLALSDLFRYSINYSGSNYCSVEEEIKMVMTYLDIEKVRFEDKLFCDLQVDDEAKLFLIPRFLLQPLVENAVKHGLRAGPTTGRIRVMVNLEESELCIRIYDNGPAFPVHFIPGYGLKSVMDKLNLLFPKEHELVFINEPEKHIKIVIRKLINHEPYLESINHRR